MNKPFKVISCNKALHLKLEYPSENYLEVFEWLDKKYPQGYRVQNIGPKVIDDLRVDFKTQQTFLRILLTGDTTCP